MRIVDGNAVASKHLTFVSDCTSVARCLVAQPRSCADGSTRQHCALSAMLTVSQLSKSFAGRALFDDVSRQVNRSNRINYRFSGPNTRSAK